MQRYRIHGDNIVECERIADIILDEVHPDALNCRLISPSTISYQVDFCYEERRYEWQIELLPGFNKNGRRRWDGDIFDKLRESGSFLDETPDAIVSTVEDESETILFAVEFCSALQAGNQAWQRSGRAFSTGRTGCPYLYIVDFVKYELDNPTRRRKALRFPNPTVPYSYINFSRLNHIFTAQAYIKSEEFNKRDRKLLNFDEANFADKELAKFIVRSMAGLDTNSERKAILEKNFNVVRFLSHESDRSQGLDEQQWVNLHQSSVDIIDFSMNNAEFPFRKKIAAKSHHGKSKELVELVEKFSIGIGSKDLPFGAIPSGKRLEFLESLGNLYGSFSSDALDSIKDSNEPLLICMLKGFKPGGDDNRPDRGALPLAAMLSQTKIDVLTFIYGPILSRSLNYLLKEPDKLANSNGLWKSILALSDYVLLDSPVLHSDDNDACEVIDCRQMKDHYLSMGKVEASLSKTTFSSSPREYHEDDVDTGIHYLFSHVLKGLCFEGMCNPPGGDWSGMSLLVDGTEARWLSLPRVSKEVDGKRPDHVVQLFGLEDGPVLLSIESKERSCDLEANVGKGLINYIEHLTAYPPSVTRKVGPSQISDWEIATERIKLAGFKLVSAAAYLNQSAQDDETVLSNSACDLLIIMDPQKAGWRIRMVHTSPQAAAVKRFLQNELLKVHNSCISII